MSSKEVFPKRGRKEMVGDARAKHETFKMTVKKVYVHLLKNALGQTKAYE